MFKKLFTEAKLKPLDTPLTDTEQKKLKSLRNMISTHKRLRPSALDLLQNLEDRENIKPAEPLKFELMSLTQIKKTGNSMSALKGVYYGATDGHYAKQYLKYAEKNQKLSADDIKEFTLMYKPQMQRMVKSKAFKTLLINIIKSQAEENNYWSDVPNQIKTWVYNILAKSDIKDLISIDPWKLYQDIEVNNSEEGWTSRQGASMTTKKAEVTFSIGNKEYREDFHLDTSGYWND